jgi:hypothetical protein
MAGDEIKFDGLARDELLGLPDNEIDALILTGRPIVFAVGSAQILGSFAIIDRTLCVELAQIDGGGEGVLIAIAALCTCFAKQRGLAGINWMVHAVTCAQPNLRLRRVLERRGFVVCDLPAIGKAYHLYEPVAGIAS